MNTCRTYSQWPTLPNTKQAWFKMQFLGSCLSGCIICHLHPAMWVLLQRIPLLHQLQIRQQIAILPKTWLVGAFGNRGGTGHDDFVSKKHIIYICVYISTGNTCIVLMVAAISAYQGRFSLCPGSESCKCSDGRSCKDLSSAWKDSKRKGGYSSSWWFQPIWKVLVKLDHFPR